MDFHFFNFISKNYMIPLRCYKRRLVEYRQIATHTLNGGSCGPTCIT